MVKQALGKAKDIGLEEVQVSIPHDNIGSIKVIEKNNAEFISKTKTTDFIRLFDRLVYHFPNIDITNYPNELSSFMNLKINSLDNARGNARKLIK